MFDKTEVCIVELMNYESKNYLETYVLGTNEMCKPIAKSELEVFSTVMFVFSNVLGAYARFLWEFDDDKDENNLQKAPRIPQGLVTATAIA